MECVEGDGDGRQDGDRTQWTVKARAAVEIRKVHETREATDTREAVETCPARADPRRLRGDGFLTPQLLMCTCYVIGFLSVIEDGFLSVIEDGFLTPLRTPPCEPPRGVCGRLRGQGPASRESERGSQRARLSHGRSGEERETGASTLLSEFASGGRERERVADRCLDSLERVCEWGKRESRGEATRRRAKLFRPGIT